MTCSYYIRISHFENVQRFTLIPVLAQLAPVTTFIPSQLAGLKIAIYRNKIQYKELDTKQVCNKTRTMTH